MSSSAKLRALDNRRLPCAVQGCQYHRSFVGQYCSWHQTCQKRYGHPLGRLIRKQEFTSYAKLARKLFKKLEDHPALTAAVYTVGALLAPGEEPRAPKPLRLNPRWLLHRELQRVHGIEPRNALAAVVGMWLFSYHQPRQLPDDQLLTYSLALAILRMRPLAITRSHYDHKSDKVENTYRCVSGLACGLLGSRLRNALAPFFLSLVALIEQEQQRATEQAMALRTPLVTSTPLPRDSGSPDHRVTHTLHEGASTP